MADKKDFELEEIRHQNKLEEIETERKAKLEVEKLSHENRMGEIRLKNANIRRTSQEKSYMEKLQNNKSCSYPE